jgi:hypothetical protein
MGIASSNVIQVRWVEAVEVVLGSWSGVKVPENDSATLMIAEPEPYAFPQSRFD